MLWIVALYCKLKKGKTKKFEYQLEINKINTQKV